MPETIDKTEREKKRGWAENVLGDTPGRLFVRLVVMSLIVGFLMAIFGVSPQDIFRSVERFFADMFDNSFEVLYRAFSYVVTGAMVVIPIWIVMRLMASARRR
ncbi:DUF6460 domain-containing protein [Pelagibacterium lentulum]|uniref:DUF6460 domain-containing protein n=1 Tax=Pelagibacterium lentulum TaxID=2029865 RepID=A0A916RHY1_9HYPH|nr:DUF6460 domain-containing protein [Pelagibacterium lentulum]GGA56843.1 hypothetical protein GCM10011499_28810 [Pelagibacterium lentulum]